MFKLIYCNGLPFIFRRQGGALYDYGGRFPQTQALLQTWFRRG